MAELMSNSKVEDLQIYGGIAAGAVAIGLAYGVDASSPIYKDKAEKKSKSKAVASNSDSKSAATTKDKAVAEAVATNEKNQTVKEQQQARQALEKTIRDTMLETASLDELNHLSKEAPNVALARNIHGLANDTQAIDARQPTAAEMADMRAHNEALRDQRQPKPPTAEEMASMQTHNQTVREQQTAQAAAEDRVKQAAWEKEDHRRWYNSLDDNDRSLVHSGLISGPQDMDYFKSAPEDTRQLMKDAHWFRQNKTNDAGKFLKVVSKVL